MAVQISKFDDVSVITLLPGRKLVIACDSLGAIGPKELDQVKVSGYTVGRFACRVPLMEVIAVGARPLLVVNTLCVEPTPTGEEILSGIRDEIEAAGLDPRISITGSMEKNVPVSQTGLGVTVIGLANGDASGKGEGLRWGLGAPGDTVVVVGMPKVGSEVRLGDNEIADIPTLLRVADYPSAGDILPVGSSGILSEARKMARRSGLLFVPNPGSEIDLEKSAGPSTCLLVSLPSGKWADFCEHLAPTGRPCFEVGRLVAK
ncbi:AIR synthase related protein [Calderihabitans maritimus]|uniref:Transcriptional regulators n=1 Tax=Calderihabitans maritimus TaxID=1246530 RepID=A0A1Z5HQY0_9FIRM|nr:AIR synthase related protein [Calderihabitans maritimus]GAW91715.1 transcriptional regulators [Calderihabitans maritimus]